MLISGNIHNVAWEIWSFWVFTIFRSNQPKSPVVWGEIMLPLSLALVSPCLSTAFSFGAPETIAMLTRWRDHRGDQHDGVGEEAEGLRFVQLGEEAWGEPKGGLLTTRNKEYVEKMKAGSFFSLVHSKGTRDNRHEGKQRRFLLGISREKTHLIKQEVVLRGCRVISRLSWLKL